MPGPHFPTTKILSRLTHGEKVVSPFKFPNIVNQLSRVVAVHPSCLEVLKPFNLPELKVNPQDAVRQIGDIARIKGLPEVFRVASHMLLDVKTVYLLDAKNYSIPVHVLVRKGFSMDAAEGKSIVLIIGGKQCSYKMGAEQNLPLGLEIGPSLVAKPEIVTKLVGIPVSAGFGEGPAQIYRSWEAQLNITRTVIEDSKIDAEVLRFKKAYEEVYDYLCDLESRLVENGKEMAANITGGHKLLMNPMGEKYEKLDEAMSFYSEMFRDTVIGIKNEKLNAEHVLEVVINNVVTKMKDAAENGSYLAGRAEDIEDIGRKVLEKLCGIVTEDLATKIKNSNHKQKFVLVARALRPSDTCSLALIADQILAIVTEGDGPTSHTAILARGYDIPCVVGVPNATTIIKENDRLSVDGGRGTVLINPEENSEDHIAFITHSKQHESYIKKLTSDVKGKDSVTLDKHPFYLGANMSHINELPKVLMYDLAGISLFRSEFLYLGRKGFPTEDELFETFRKLAVTIPGNIEVIVRAPDFGGDKGFPEYFGIPKEETYSPLGLRGIRVFFRNDKNFLKNNVLTPFLRAIMRASSYNPNLKFMFPVIANMSEVRQCKREVEAVQETLRRESKNFNEAIEIGAMVELVSAALIARRLSGEMKFLKIGTNDLIQFIFGAGRDDINSAHLYNPFHDSVWKLLKMIRTGSIVNLGICGDMAADPAAALMLMGLGIDSYGVVPSDSLKVKYTLTRAKKADCMTLVNRFLDEAENPHSTFNFNRDGVKSLIHEIFPLDTVVSAINLIDGQGSAGN